MKKGSTMIQIQPEWMLNKIWTLSPSLLEMYKRNRLNIQKPTSRNSTDPLSINDVYEMFTFYWPGHVLKIQHSLSILHSTRQMMNFWMDESEINIIDIAVGSATGSLAFTDYVNNLPLGKACRNANSLKINYIISDISLPCLDVSKDLIRKYYESIDGSSRVRLGEIIPINEPFPQCVSNLKSAIRSSSASKNIIIATNALDLLLLNKHNPPKSWTSTDFSRYYSKAFDRLVDVRRGFADIVFSFELKETIVFILQEKKYMYLVDFLAPNEHVSMHMPTMFQAGYRPDMPKRVFPINYKFLAYHINAMTRVNSGFPVCHSFESEFVEDQYRELGFTLGSTILPDWKHFRIQ